MDTYLLGLLTVPAILAATLLAWFSLTLVGKAFVGITTLVFPNSITNRRANMGGLIATANRAVMIRFGGASAVVLVHGKRVDSVEMRAASDALYDHMIERKGANWTGA